jgi:hypothetical protein
MEKTGFLKRKGGFLEEKVKLGMWVWWMIAYLEWKSYG